MSKQIVLIDAHVHVYPGVDVPGLLTAAAGNFSAAARVLDATGWQGLLMLTEVAGVDWFDSVADKAGGCMFGPWRVVHSSADPISLQASAQGTTITIVAGRQIVTAERIEVHALGTRTKFTDGRPTLETVEAVHAIGALTVLPWGVGKWLGSRGRLVEDILTSPAMLEIYASDNGGRPRAWSEPRFALRPGQPLLGGSDPLPLLGEEYRVGEYGSWLEGTLPVNTPATALLTRISSLRRDQLHSYGKPETIVRFFKNQLQLRLKRRRLF